MCTCECNCFFLLISFDFLSSACEDLNKEVESSLPISSSSSSSLSLEKPLKEHRAGSVIVHECCADYMAKCRHVALGRAKRVEVRYYFFSSSHLVFAIALTFLLA